MNADPPPAGEPDPPVPHPADDTTGEGGTADGDGRTGPGELIARIAGAARLPLTLAHRPLPTPPAVLRQGPLREGAFTPRLHSRRQAAILGVALGVTFLTCFLTGLLSHLIQNPPSWFAWPGRPVGLYRVTQGVHIATGIASIPLLAAKLWTVYPRFWEWPPVRTAAHAIERASLLLLVGGAVTQLATGVANVAGWYPFRFFFTPTHYAVAWITIGALLVHIGTKAAITRAALARGADPEPDGDGLSRRGFLTAVTASAGALTVATVGETVRPLASVSVLAARDPRAGPQGTPVNQSARAAGVLVTARDPAYRLTVERGKRPLSFDYAALQALPQHSAVLPISCVEGWSASRHWTGVRLRDLLDMAGIAHDNQVRVLSLERGGLYAASIVDAEHARDPDTLLALLLNGETLAIDHGYPVRLISPNRPGVLQTKWVYRLQALGPGHHRGLIT